MTAPGAAVRMRLMTPPGEGGISVIRLAGAGAETVARAVFRCRAFPDPGAIAYGHIVNEDGAIVDEVVLAAVAPPGGPTLFEINCHGGPVPTRLVMEQLARRGVAIDDQPQPLLPGEDSALERELWTELVRAQTSLAVSALLRQLGGALRREVEAITGVSHEGSRRDACATLDEERLRALAGTARFGLRLTRPASVAIVGPPNAGKSTLMNRLLQTERVLVYHEPGTTRDVISELAGVRGMPVRLSDTAGIGLESAKGEPDAAAARKAWGEISGADLLIVLFDGARPPSPVDRALVGPCRAKALFAVNKSDLRMRYTVEYEDLVGASVLAISARSGEGVTELEDAVVRALTGGPGDPGGAVLVTERQKRLVEESLGALETGQSDRAIGVLRQVIFGPPGVL